MNWLNINIPSALRSPEFVGSSPAERGTWLSVLGYAVTIECGGTIEGAASWKDRQWQQTCGVTIREIRAASRLLHFDENHVVVIFYPADKEQEVKAKREAGRVTAEKRWHRAANSSAISSASSSAHTEGEGEGEGNIIPPYPLAGGSTKTKSDPESKQPKAKGTLQLRAEAIMHRKATTPLTSGEDRAFAKNRAAIESTSEDDWQILERFYREPRAKTFARKDLATLLNNWNGEIDRAKGYFQGSTKLAIATTLRYV
jgi:hypothetical protein